MTSPPHNCEERSSPRRAGNDLCLMNLHRRALGRARARYFFRQKSNQKGLQQKGFFALKAFALQTGQNHGLQLFCPASPTLTPTSAKTCYALSITHTHHRSARFRPKLICCEKAFSFNLVWLALTLCFTFKLPNLFLPY